MKKAVIFILALIIFLAVFVLPASANSGPPYKVSDGGAQFFIPDKSDSIKVSSENLTYDITIADSQKSAQAEVTAQYDMTNSSSETEKLLVAFVSNNPENVPEVYFDEQNVEVLDSRSIPWAKFRKPDGSKVSRYWGNVGSWTNYGVWEPAFSEILYLFDTGMIHEDRGAVDYDLEVTLFELEFAPIGVHTLEVSYTEIGTVIRKRAWYSYGYDKEQFEFYYFLEPAQYWKDFSDLTVDVRVNGALDTEETSLSGFRKSGGLYTAYFDDLPQKNLRLVVEHQNLLSRAFPFIVSAVIILALVLVVRTWRKQGRIR